MIFLPLFNSVTAMVRCEGRRLVQSCLSGTGLLAQSAGHVASCSSSLWRLRGRRASLEVRGLAPVLVAASAAFAGSLIALSPGRAPVGNRRAQRVVAPAGPERSSFLASEIDGRRGVRARHRVTVTRYFRGRPEVDCEPLVSLEGALSSTHDVSVVRHDTLPSTSSGFAAARYTIELAPEAHTTVCVPTDGYIVLRWPGTRELPPLQDVVPVRILQE